ncbi:MAG: RtcB family protein [Actinomycetes bacterium]
MDLKILASEESQTLRVFDDESLRADPAALRQLAEGVGGADLVASPVVLPDFHHKKNQEMPSSIAVATADSIRPTLTSSSVNCGMALLALNTERPSGAALDAFFRSVRERYPVPPSNRSELPRQDVVRAAAEGAAFGAERYGVDDADLERVELDGRVDLTPYGGHERLTKDLPWLAFQLARLRFGTVGPSNHFVELQEVEEVFDEPTARLLGISQGQLTLQYHCGGGALAGQIGRMFGRRRNYPKHLRMAMAVQKPMMHLASARSRAQLQERWALYFQDGCPPVSRTSDEGRRLMLANSAAMNYGFAFRMATYAALRQLAVDAFGGTPGRLVVDSPHNSVYEETVNGESAIVHRHNSCRAYPADQMRQGTVFAETGQAVLIPGTHRTSSLLAVTGPQAADSLYSACHGTGTVIQQFVDSGKSGPDPLGRATRRYRYNDAEPTVDLHHDDIGIDHATSILSGYGLVRPVARLRPMAVLH